MADGKLTWRDFWKLTPEERLERCGELSEHDAYMVRLTDPGLPRNPPEVPCNECIHRTEGKPYCAAFPDGLTADHIRAVMQDKGVPCGGGYRFEQKRDG